VVVANGRISVLFRMCFAFRASRTSRKRMSKSNSIFTDISYQSCVGSGILKAESSKHVLQKKDPSIMNSLKFSKHVLEKKDGETNFFSPSL
jgi:hypothetical protein